MLRLQLIGNYSIRASADAVQGETDTADNALTDGWILVTMQVDVNDNGIVDIFDFVIMTVRFRETDP